MKLPIALTGLVNSDIELLNGYGDNLLTRKEFNCGNKTSLQAKAKLQPATTIAIPWLTEQIPAADHLSVFGPADSTL